MDDSPGTTVDPAAAPSRGRKRRRRGYVIAAVGASLVLALGAFGVLFVDWSPEPEAGMVQDVGDLWVGDCIGDFDPDFGYTEVTTIPCADEHNAQVVGRFEMPPGDYPHLSTVTEQADAACPSQFESFVPSAVDRAAYLMFYLPASEADWVAGNRSVRCIAWISHPVEGSAHDG